MNETKNLTTFMVISILILFLWYYFVEMPKIVEAQKQLELQQSAKNVVSERAIERELQPDIPLQAVSREEAINGHSKAKRVTIKSSKLHGSLFLQGARFDDLTLAEYKESLGDDAKEVALLSPQKSTQSYYADFSWLSNTGTKVPNSKTVWTADKKELTPESPVTLTWNNGEGLVFTNIISMDEHYLFDIKQHVKNVSAGSVTLYPYGRINRVKALPESPFFILHEGVLGVLDGVLEEITYKDMQEDKKQSYKETKGWLGITDKYWITALVPEQDNGFDANFSYVYRDGKDRYQVDYLGREYTIAAGEEVSFDSHLFAGAKKVRLLDKYGQDLNVPLFDRAVDFGVLYFITKPIFLLLTAFNAALGNFGLAILMLTVVVKLLMFPLANKSYVSMHGLKRLQPKMMELKERYKYDKVQMNKEVMELYKREKVNPMAGCLPLLIQLPVFFALYKVLFVTIEMRHAPFYGWVQDLSAPDPTTIFNLFGLLPFTPPAFIPLIGIWPLIMGLSMYLQQKMNPQPADPVQAKVMKMLPFIFVFIFATFPAGLVIYWAWNNILSILQQWIITRKLPPVEAAK